MLAHLEIMYSDKIATLTWEENVTTFEHEENVADQVNGYLEDQFVKLGVPLESIKLQLLSYINAPKIPKNLNCFKWILICDSHPPFLYDLITAIPLNCELLHILVDNGGLGHICSMEQVVSAKDLELKTTDMNRGSAFGHVTKDQLAKLQAKKLNVYSAIINEEDINKVLIGIMSSDITEYSLRITFKPTESNPIDIILNSYVFENVNSTFLIKSTTRTSRLVYNSGTVELNIS